MTKVRLIAPVGTDECNNGANRYRVANNGIVEVDFDAVAPLLKTGGFRLADPPQVPDTGGTVRIYKSDDPDAVLTIFGTAYVPDEAGILTVPTAFLEQAQSHGFQLVQAPRKLEI